VAEFRKLAGGRGDLLPEVERVFEGACERSPTSYSIGKPPSLAAGLELAERQSRRVSRPVTLPGLPRGTRRSRVACTPWPFPEAIVRALSGAVGSESPVGRPGAAQFKWQDLGRCMAPLC
jgi:hypothetical protein